MAVFSFPFRVSPYGSIATIEEGSDEETAERIAALMLTRRGERELVPAFGVEDPTFAQPDEAELAAGLAIFGPDVDFTMKTDYPTDHTARVEIAFT